MAYATIPTRCWAPLLCTISSSIPDKYSWCGIWTDMTIEYCTHTLLPCAVESHPTHGDSRGSCSRDHADTATFLTWLNLKKKTFKRTSHFLASLASGDVANAAVNCNDALFVGEGSVKAMEGKLFSETHLQRKNSARSLASVTKAVKVRGEDVCINPNQLFHRIVCIVRSEEELSSI